MYNFRYILFSAQDIALAGLASKLRQIASICKKAEKAQWMGYLEQMLRFNLRSAILALGVKMYWGQALFFKH